MSLEATHWAARQFLHTPNEQLVLRVLAEAADQHGLLPDVTRAREALAVRARLSPAGFVDVLFVLWRIGAVGPATWDGEEEMRLELRRTFDFRRPGEHGARAA